MRNSAKKILIRYFKPRLVDTLNHRDFLHLKVETTTIGRERETLSPQWLRHCKCSYTTNWAAKCYGQNSKKPNETNLGVSIHVQSTNRLA